MKNQNQKVGEMSPASLFQTTPEKAQDIMSRIRNPPEPRTKTSVFKVDLACNLGAEPLGTRPKSHVVIE
jgi:hypothetical protein